VLLTSLLCALVTPELFKIGCKAFALLVRLDNPQVRSSAVNGSLREHILLALQVMREDLLSVLYICNILTLESFGMTSHTNG